MTGKPVSWRLIKRWGDSQEGGCREGGRPGPHPALVGDYPGELVGDTEAPLRLGEEHHPTICRDSSAIEGGAHLLARYRWQVKGQRDIVVHNSLPLLDRCAASATGIMPHIQVSGYFRLTVPADEVIE